MAHCHRRNHRGSRHDCPTCNINPPMLSTVTTYAALSQRIRAAVSTADLEALEKRCDRHYAAGTITPHELSRLDELTMDRIAKNGVIIDELHIALSVLERREIDFAMRGMVEHRNSTRLATLPIKREINKLEGREIYPEASH